MNIFLQYINIAINSISFAEPKILVPLIIMSIAIFAPFLFWFIRNFMRIVLKINWDWLNRSLKWFFIGGLILFIISLILLILPIVGIY